MTQLGTELRPVFRQVVANIDRVLIGKQREVQMVLVAVLCQGHILIEDVPGVGKTTLVRALARSLGCQFRRIQFTPDLLPSDITGVSIWNPATGQFEFRPGPIMSQIVLADEINRTSPKTQAALLEAMEERQMTVDGVTYPLPRPFLVMATQNPIEYEGTFPLPEAQLDRFLLRLRLGYPSREEERRILRQAGENLLLDLEPVMTPEELVAAQGEVTQVQVEASVEDYLLHLISRTREHRDVYLGASPRAAIALYRAAQALAYLRGRDYVLPDDVKEMAPLVLGHRILLRPEARLRGLTPADLLARILQEVPVPTGVRSHSRSS
ncbi:MAG: MoxR family ATPase [Bacillota bacterium]